MQKKEHEGNISINKALQRYFLKWGTIHQFRTVLNIALPKGKNEYIGYIKNAFELLKPGREYAHWIKVSDNFFESKEYQLSIEYAINQGLNDTENIIDSVSLVFSHSVLDALLYDFLSIACFMNPELFCLTLGPKKKIEIKELSNNKMSEIYDRISNQIIQKVERESLVEKTDYLYMICSPPDDWRSMRNFKFDRDLLVKFDDIRHKIVHGPMMAITHANIEEKLFEIQKIGMHFFGMMNYKFGLQIINISFNNIEPKDIIF